MKDVSYNLIFSLQSDILLLATLGGNMRKRIILIAFTAVALVSLFVVLYDQFKPKTSALTLRADMPKSETVKLNEIQTFLNDNPGQHVFLLKDGDADSDYVEEALLAPLTTEQVVRPTPDIISVDMSEAQNISVTRLKQLLGVEKYPAFVVIEAKKDSVEVKSTLVFKQDNPFTSDDLKTWFFENGLWTGPYGIENKKS